MRRDIIALSTRARRRSVRRLTGHICARNKALNQDNPTPGTDIRHRILSCVCVKRVLIEPRLHLVSLSLGGGGGILGIARYSSGEQELIRALREPMISPYARGRTGKNPSLPLLVSLSFTTRDDKSRLENCDRFAKHLTVFQRSRFLLRSHVGFRQTVRESFERKMCRDSFLVRSHFRLNRFRRIRSHVS